MLSQSFMILKVSDFVGFETILGVVLSKEALIFPTLQ